MEKFPVSKLLLFTKQVLSTSCVLVIEFEDNRNKCINKYLLSPPYPPYIRQHSCTINMKNMKDSNSYSQRGYMLVRERKQTVNL